mmetsp:Transcript_19035/g.26792  ORF Transcript_19035/g.26792 Transcript_19035/m.26792 type:complete len:248 (+) Transcript_19035:53-796(+)
MSSHAEKFYRDGDGENDVSENKIIGSDSYYPSSEEDNDRENLNNKSQRTKKRKGRERSFSSSTDSSFSSSSSDSYSSSDARSDSERDVGRRNERALRKTKRERCEKRRKRSQLFSSDLREKHKPRKIEDQPREERRINKKHRRKKTDYRSRRKSKSHASKKEKKKCSDKKERKHKKYKRKSREESETKKILSRNHPSNLEASVDDKSDVRRSAISGRIIKMHIEKTDEDIARDKARKEMLKFMNSSF